MTYEIVFALAFLSQVLILSWFFPKRIQNRAADTQADDKVKPLAFYRSLNNLVIFIGVGLAVCWFALGLFEEVVPRLASLGGFFFLQMMPLLTPGVSRTLSPPASDDQADSGQSLFDFVSPSAVAIALILFFSYMALEVSQWDGTKDTQLIKMANYAGTNIFFAAILVWTLVSLRRGEDTDGKKRQGAQRVIPILVYLSIGISIYYFGKQILATFSLTEVRPIMMSVFMQLLAMLTLGSLLRSR